MCVTVCVLHSEGGRGGGWVGGGGGGWGGVACICARANRVGG